MPSADFTDDERAAERQAISERLDPSAEIGPRNAILRSASKPARRTAPTRRANPQPLRWHALTAGNTLLRGSVGRVSPAMEINMADEVHPCETVPKSGTHRVTHNARHLTAEHEPTVIKGRRFPNCRQSKSIDLGPPHLAKHVSEIPHLHEGRRNGARVTAFAEGCAGGTA